MKKALIIKIVAAVCAVAVITGTVIVVISKNKKKNNNNDQNGSIIISVDDTDNNRPTSSKVDKETESSDTDNKDDENEFRNPDGTYNYAYNFDEEEGNIIGNWGDAIGNNCIFLKDKLCRILLGDIEVIGSYETDNTTYINVTYGDETLKLKIERFETILSDVPGINDVLNIVITDEKNNTYTLCASADDDNHYDNDTDFIHNREHNDTNIEEDTTYDDDIVLDDNE